ncbi:hypothetical protein SAMN04487949_3036 [Halogranum gelatinilyticum]|uniref:DUF8056 domain-containing protein n=1 Tax=Halogranum gelatinilyticum TaxID=660521 RepID=A0A1G9XMP4_9EURY|nr:hypothetical protein [Halogranum gelatinilyticum]SDM97475.1 hypothetical protein SAMN04487949_3036 [Halogranum gelatinilyticum]
MADGYRGLFGAFPYAFGSTDSRLFKSYVLVGGVAAAALSLFVLLALVVLIGQTASIQGGSLTLSRAFYIVVGLFVVTPVLAPVLLVARRHRRELAAGAGARYDQLLAVAGYLFLASLFVGLVISVPAEFQTPPTGFFAPVVSVLYGLPPLAGLLPPFVAGLLILAVHRVLGR